ncbi:hypothetical protein DL771_010092 [Monosporascus sp. 5C6A]|nr:hypothetical protein DL771_010092 [Monosporascus sp. 5C6A]
MSHVVPFHLKDLHSASKVEVSGLVPRRSSVYLNNLNPKNAKPTAEEPKIPSPKLFASLTHTAPTAPESDLPTVSECAVHLELLEVFYKLRLDIIKSKKLDVTFGVTIDKKTVYRKTYDYTKRKYVNKPVQLKDTTWPTRRRQKWSYFLGIAVGRFKIWMKRMNEFLKAPNTPEDWAAFMTGTNWLRLPFLPPLDVLMVWHAFLLNPHDYDKAWRRYDLARVCHLPFPWKAVHDVINSRDWTYTLPREAKDWAKTHATLEPDLFRYLCKASKTTNSVSTTLARYGQRNVHILPPGELLNMQDLTVRDSAFLATIQQTEAGKHADKALIDNVQRPTVEGTLRRAVDRYEKFLRLFHLYPGKMLVPTLDIDIVWHTHQCSARRYAESVKRRTGVFINHDDRLGRPVLDGGMEETKTLFFVRFGEEYQRCLCWDCEAIASIIEEADEDVGLEEGDVSALVEKLRKDVEYYRCVEIARRQGTVLALLAYGLIFLFVSMNLFVLLYFWTVAAATVGANLVLPALTGPHAVGTTVIEIVDHSRQDPQAPTPQPRDLMISLFYPTVTSPGAHNCTLAPQIPPITAAAYEDAYNIPRNLLPNILTRSCLDAPLALPDLPVLFFTPGYTGSRLLSTALLQEIASYGWNVVSIDHPFEAVVVEYPDGRVARQIPYTGNDTFGEAARNVPIRVADLTSVLNALTYNETIICQIPGLCQREGCGRRLRTDRVGVFGHSLGGATALQATADDPRRFVVGANLDGSFFGPAVQTGTDVPFLILASEIHNRSMDATWAETWPRLRGLRRQYNVAGALHLDFFDLPVLRDMWGSELPPDLDENVGTIAGVRIMGIMRTFLGSLFSRVMKGEDDGLLDGIGLEEWPEVSIGE